MVPYVFLPSLPLSMRQFRWITAPVTLNTNVLLATEAAGSNASDTTGTVTTVAFPRLATV